MQCDSKIIEQLHKLNVFTSNFFTMARSFPNRWKSFLRKYLVSSSIWLDSPSVKWLYLISKWSSCHCEFKLQSLLISSCESPRTATELENLDNCAVLPCQEEFCFLSLEFFDVKTRSGAARTISSFKFILHDDPYAPGCINWPEWDKVLWATALAGSRGKP